MARTEKVSRTGSGWFPRISGIPASLTPLPQGAAVSPGFSRLSGFMTLHMLDTRHNQVANARKPARLMADIPRIPTVPRPPMYPATSRGLRYGALHTEHLAAALAGKPARDSAGPSRPLPLRTGSRTRSSPRGLSFGSASVQASESQADYRKPRAGPCPRPRKSSDSNGRRG